MLHTRVHPPAIRALTVSRRVAVALAFALSFSTATTLTSCASVGGSGTGAAPSSGSYSQRDERRVIGSYADVRNVAVSRRFVYAATISGIGIYDRLFNRWLAPLEQEPGLVDGQITVMTGDPVEDAVWLGVPGAVLMYRPQTEQLQRTSLTGVPDYIAFDRAPSGDAYVRASGVWNRVSRAGIASPISAPPPAAQLVRPQTLADVYQRFPSLRSAQAFLFRNQRSDRPLRTYAVQSGTLSLDTPSEVWLGTNGDGLFKADGVTVQSTPVRYGLLERGIGALALAADGVWAAGLGQSSTRGGLTFASFDLQRWRWIDGTISVPMLGLRATSMSVRAQRAWIGTDRGVVRVNLDEKEGIEQWTSLTGLADERVTSVVARDDGAWVGSLRGLVYITDTSRVRNFRTNGVTFRGLEGTSVYALQSVSDTLWIGSALGLLALPANGNLSRPAGSDPALNSRIVALAYSDSVLLAATETSVLQLNPHGGREPSRVQALNVSLVGQVTRLAMDDRTIVMAGTDGVVVLQRRGGVRVLQVPRDIPAAALDVALSRDWLWIATPAGLVRLRRAGDGGLP